MSVRRRGARERGSVPPSADLSLAGELDPADRLGSAPRDRPEPPPGGRPEDPAGRPPEPAGRPEAPAGLPPRDVAPLLPVAPRPDAPELYGLRSPGLAGDPELYGLRSPGLAGGFPLPEPRPDPAEPLEPGRPLPLAPPEPRSGGRPRPLSDTSASTGDKELRSDQVHCASTRPDIRMRATPTGMALIERMSGGVLLSHAVTRAVPSAL